MEDKVVVKEEQHKYGNNLNMLLQGPFVFVEDVVRAILRCLGLRLDDNECSSSVVVIPPITCSITHVSNSSASDNSGFHETTTTTTTITDGVPGQEQKQEEEKEKEKEKEEIGVPSETPVSADGIDVASSNADSGSTETTAITTNSGEEEEEEKKEKEETCPPSQTPDSGAADVGGEYPGTVVDQPGIGPVLPSPVQV
ncbi:hypothetical protein SOVF_075020, partial [Spinacia oleracea]